MSRPARTSKPVETYTPEVVSPKAAAKKSTAKAGKAKPKKKEGPKKTNPFMLFSTEKREGLKAKNPDATFGELGKLAGEAWKKLSEKEQQTYKDKAAAANAKAQKDWDKKH